MLIPHVGPVCVGQFFSREWGKQTLNIVELVQTATTLLGQLG